MIRDRSKLKPNVAYYAAHCFSDANYSWVDPAQFFNKSIKDKRSICFDMVYHYSVDPVIGYPVFFDSLEEIDLLIRKLDREIFDVVIWTFDGLSQNGLEQIEIWM